MKSQLEFNTKLLNIYLQDLYEQSEVNTFSWLLQWRKSSPFLNTTETS